VSARTFEELRVEFDRVSRIHDVVGLEHCALALEALGTPAALAIAENARGAVDRLHGEYASALERFERSVAICEELGDRKGMALGLGNIGLVLASTGTYVEALAHMHRTLSLYEEVDDRKGMAVAMTNIGNVYNYTGDYAQAIELFQRARSMYEALEDHVGIASVSMGLGNAWYYTGEYAQTLEQFKIALKHFEELGDRGGAASVISNIGAVYFSMADYAAALEYRHRAVAMFEELGLHTNAANDSGNIGNVYAQTGEYPLALEQYHRSLAVSLLHGDRSTEAYITAKIGSVYASMGDNEKAIEHFERALSMHHELGERSGIAGLTFTIGGVRGNMGDVNVALESFRKALMLYEELGDRRGIALVRSSILSALIALHAIAEAEALLQDMDSMLIEEPSTILYRELSRAAIQSLHGNDDAATHTLLAALDVAREHNIAATQASIHRELRDLCQKRNDFPGYIEHNSEFTRITEEINGKETATKVAMQESQRRIDAERKEHERHMAVLHSTLPKHIADRVARGEVVNDTFDNAAVLFLDVVGFTTHTSALDAGVVVALLQNIFTTFDAICAEHNVMKIKTIGDSYMAVGFPSEHHVEDLATVALAMQACEFTWPHTSEPVQFRIGLHVGPVVAGVLGTERLQYDVWGDTVNVASRMETSGEAGRVHVSAAFAANLQSNTEYRIQNSISESDNQESHEVPLVTSHLSLVTTSTSLVTFLRGEIDVKGKGMMKTYWLEKG